jgi:hypothetical protein
MLRPLRGEAKDVAPFAQGTDQTVNSALREGLLLTVLRAEFPYSKSLSLRTLTPQVR